MQKRPNIVFEPAGSVWPLNEEIELVELREKNEELRKELDARAAQIAAEKQRSETQHERLIRVRKNIHLFSRTLDVFLILRNFYELGVMISFFWKHQTFKKC